MLNAKRENEKKQDSSFEVFNGEDISRLKHPWPNKYLAA
jgi:hypothetical protein